MDSKQSQSAARQEHMIYICGDCQAENSLKTKDAIKCRECGHRVLYKKRARKCMFIVIN